MVDDGSHDPTLILPVALAAADGGRLAIPAVASNPGAEQTMWRSDVSLVNLSDVVTDITVTFHQNGLQQSTSVSIPEHSALQLDDVVRESFDATGSGWLEIDPSGAGVVANSRTFNDAESGSFGQFVPAVPFDGAVLSGETAVLGGLSSDGSRTNVGFTSLSDNEVTITMVIYENSGVIIGALDVAVPAMTFVQVTRLLERELGFTGPAWATVHCDDPGAAFLAHASVVDNQSGDPIYIPAVVR